MMVSNVDSYNYATFPSDDDVEFFQQFAEHLKPGETAPDMDLLDLESGATVRLRDITQRGLTVIELGSFT
jgi:hypothetical protein